MAFKAGDPAICALYKIGLALDNFQAARHANGKWDSRHTITHLEFVHPNDMKRFGKLGVLAAHRRAARVADAGEQPQRLGQARIDGRREQQEGQER